MLFPSKNDDVFVACYRNRKALRHKSFSSIAVFEVMQL